MEEAEVAVVPARVPRVFYGWWIVLGALVAQFVSVGTQAPVAGAFLVPMTQDLGWDRSQFTIATSLGTGVSALVGFFIGTYVDRWGARPLMLVGGTILGATLIAISRVETLWQFILLRGIVFTFGFVLIGNLVVNVTVSKWFVERRGWAISIASLGVSAGSIIITPIMVRLVDSIGWRDAWVIMGLASWALLYPVAMLMRRQPEDYGLRPDGAREDDEGAAETIARAAADFANSFARGEAVRTATMWLLVGAFGLATVGLISVLFHAIPFLTDSGISRTNASLFFSLQGVAALLSKFAWGYWMQRFHPRVLTALSFVCAGTGVALMVPAAHAHSIPMLVAAFLLYGWGVGGQIPLQEFIWAAFFGRRHLGAVRSAALPVTIIFSASGPYFAGLYYDVIGSYDGAFITFTAFWAAAAVLVLAVRSPRKTLAAAALDP